jgi:hypothetical protein
MAFAFLAAVGCSSDDGDVVVIANSESGRSVIASPVDPRRVHAEVVRRLRAAGPVGDSIARYYALADSADSLDGIFQEQRAALNRDARAMATVDRRTPSYAREFDAYMKRVATATRARESRDRLRRRATALRTRLGSRMSAVTRTIAPRVSAVAKSDVCRWARGSRLAGAHRWRSGRAPGGLRSRMSAASCTRYGVTRFERGFATRYTWGVDGSTCERGADRSAPLVMHARSVIA